MIEVLLLGALILVVLAYYVQFDRARNLEVQLDDANRLVDRLHQSNSHLIRENTRLVYDHEVLHQYNLQLATTVRQRNNTVSVWLN